MIEERDEWLHEVGNDPAWQESFYFNWADPQRRSFTLARTGYRFHPRKIDGLVISLRDAELELFYGPADLDHAGDPRDEDPAAGMRAGDLVVTMLEALPGVKEGRQEAEKLRKELERSPAVKPEVLARKELAKAEDFLEKYADRILRFEAKRKEARKKLQRIVDKWPDTRAAASARARIDALDAMASD